MAKSKNCVRINELITVGILFWTVVHRLWHSLDSLDMSRFWRCKAVLSRFFLDTILKIPGQVVFGGFYSEIVRKAGQIPGILCMGSGLIY